MHKHIVKHMYYAVPRLCCTVLYCTVLSYTTILYQLRACVRIMRIVYLAAFISASMYMIYTLCCKLMYNL